MWMDEMSMKEGDEEKSVKESEEEKKICMKKIRKKCRWISVDEKYECDAWDECGWR